MKKQMQTLFWFMPKLNRHDVPVILWNLFPFMGVVFGGWKPESVFICYALETVIVGVFNVIKMIAIYFSGVQHKEEEASDYDWGMIPFFIFHYFIFVVFQLSFCLQPDPDAELAAILAQRSYNMALGAFVLNNVYSFINDFMLTGTYAKRTMREQMFEPYPRVLVQQFVVILGISISNIIGNGYPVLIVFVGIKIYMDLLLRKYPLASLLKKKLGEM